MIRNIVDAVIDRILSEHVNVCPYIESCDEHTRLKGIEDGPVYEREVNKCVCSNGVIPRLNSCKLYRDRLSDEISKEIDAMS